MHAREYKVGDGSDNINAVVPVTLLGALSQREGVRQIARVRPRQLGSR